MLKLLVVEDEPKLCEFLREGLVEHKFNVRTCSDGVLAKNILESHKFDLVILDVMLPQISGFELCRYIKTLDENCPVILLTALGATQDKLDGFDAGADDYLVKPFEFVELLARIRVLTKRVSKERERSTLLTYEDLQLDLDRKEAVRGNNRIVLTAKEFALLEFLLINAGKVQSRATIAERVWDLNFDTGTNVVDVYINILRKKIDANFEHKLIKTKVGLGYFIGE